MADSKLKSDISNIVKDVASLIKMAESGKTAVADCNKKNEQLNEMINVIYNIVNDISQKCDIFITQTGLKTPVVAELTEKKNTRRASAKKAAPKTEAVINNVMTFFRKKYLDDQCYWDDILSSTDENGVKITGEQFRIALFEEHLEDLKNKVGINKIKTQNNILYKSLDKTQKNTLRELLVIENNGIKKNKKVDAVKDVLSDVETYVLVEEDADD